MEENLSSGLQSLKYQSINQHNSSQVEVAFESQRSQHDFSSRTTHGPLSSIHVNKHCWPCKKSLQIKYFQEGDRNQGVFHFRGSKKQDNIYCTVYTREKHQMVGGLGGLGFTGYPQIKDRITLTASRERGLIEQAN